MSTLTALYEDLNHKISKLRMIDIAYTKFAVFFFTLFLVDLFPVLLAWHWGWYLALALVIALPVQYRVWFAK